MGEWQSNIKDKQTNKNPWQVTSCLEREREDWRIRKRINRTALSNNGRHTLLPPCFYLSSILVCSLLPLLLLLHQPLCFDSALYLYFKWLNYTGSRGENYGCFPLFLSTGTPWPLPGSNNSPFFLLLLLLLLLHPLSPGPLSLSTCPIFPPLPPSAHFSR